MACILDAQQAIVARLLKHRVEGDAVVCNGQSSLLKPLRLRNVSGYRDTAHCFQDSCPAFSHAKPGKLRELRLHRFEVLAHRGRAPVAGNPDLACRGLQQRASGFGMHGQGIANLGRELG